MHYGGRLEGPRPFLHPFPVETRWTNQITSFSLFLARCFSLLLTLFPSSLSLSLSIFRQLYLCLFLRLSSLRRFAVALTLPLFFSPSLSLSFLLSPHYPTHNRTRARKTLRLSLLIVPLLLVLPICGLQLKYRSQGSLQKILLRSFPSTLLSSLKLTIIKQEEFDRRYVVVKILIVLN